MNEGAARLISPEGDDNISLLAWGNVLLRRRTVILTLGLVGATVGLAWAMLVTRVYASSAKFLPQVSEGRPSGLALVASQLGIQVPSGSGGWGPPVYAELLQSRALLEPIVLDTVEVSEEGGRRVAVLDLLRIRAATPARRAELGVRALDRLVDSREIKALNAVELTVTTRWPSVSLAFADRLVQAVNQFNVETRRSQAAAERQFVEAQAAEAERALREVEDRLQRFLQRNRVISSPELAFERDRLQREVNLRQQVYTSLLQSREEARIREVRDTPVITILEEPRLPVVPRSRRGLQKILMGGLGGVAFGVVIAFLIDAFSGARRSSSEEAKEFFQLVDDATPRFLRRAAK